MEAANLLQYIFKKKGIQNSLVDIMLHGTRTDLSSFRRYDDSSIGIG